MTTYCKAKLNYVGNNDVLPVEMSIENGREVSGLTWEKSGFELLQHQPSVTDWTNDVEIEAHHYPEMEALAQRLTGCRTALISGHICRNPNTADTHSDYAPIEFVHSDFTDDYGDRVKQRYAEHPEETASALNRAGIKLDDLLNAEHMMILQFWRNVGPAAMDRPLAFCDASTVPETDVHAIHVPNYAGGDFAFDTFAVTPPTQGREHKWYTFPELQANEVVALRTFDSRRVGTLEPYWTPHTAFLDPNLNNPPARFSIEVRATCLF